MTMLTAKLSRVLLVMGAAVGLVGITVFALDLRISIPDWMIRVAMIKLALVASLGLLGAGALVGRHVKREESRKGSDPRHSPDELVAGTFAVNVTGLLASYVALALGFSLARWARP